MQNAKKQSPSLSADEHYRELTSRNYHFIPPGTQKQLRSLRVLIAGCGSTGGACTQALARVGVTQFHLADNGEYELTNLNRQHARIESIGTNKAIFHRDEILSINPFASCLVKTEGVSVANVRELCEGVDLIFDAVDVTTEQGIQAKIALHREAKRKSLPVLSALDLGLCQWGMSFDYRNQKLEIFDGKEAALLKAKHPIKALFTIYPESAIPDHCVQLFIDLLDGNTDFASQLGCTSDLLSGIVVASVIRLVETGTLIPGWEYNLNQIRSSKLERFKERFTQFSKRQYMRKRLREIA